jgi:hypothetical protein
MEILPALQGNPDSLRNIYVKSPATGGRLVDRRGRLAERDVRAQVEADRHRGELALVADREPRRAGDAGDRIPGHRAGVPAIALDGAAPDRGRPGDCWNACAVPWNPVASVAGTPRSLAALSIAAVAWPSLRDLEHRAGAPALDQPPGPVPLGDDQLQLGPERRSLAALSIAAVAWPSATFGPKLKLIVTEGNWPWWLQGNPDSLRNIYVKSPATGGQVPLAAFATWSTEPRPRAAPGRRSPATSRRCCASCPGCPGAPAGSP